MKKGRRKYGFLTAASMVVGSVIGSGVFFKTQEISRITDGNVYIGLSAWMMGAIVMLFCLLPFAEMTEKYGDGGFYEMAEKMMGERWAHFIGFFMATVYYPSLVSTLSFLTAKYTLLAFGVENGFIFFFSAILFLAVAFLQNACSPHLSGKVQLATTFIKLIPLFLMILLGMQNGELKENLSGQNVATFRETFFPAVTATLFAYEGWISATSVGENLKNPQKNLPRALVVGGSVITAVYIFYYLGIMGAVESKTLINYGAEGIKVAFSNILGRWGALLTTFVAISCFGALNSLVMGCSASNREIFGEKAPHFTGFIISILWLFYLFAQQGKWAGSSLFDSTELPVVTLYALYIPMFLSFAKSEKNARITLLCIGGICASLFAVICGTLAHRGEIISYILILLSIMLFAKKR